MTWSGHGIPLLLVVLGLLSFLAGGLLGSVGGVYLVSAWEAEAVDPSAGCMGAEVVAMFLVFCGTAGVGLGFASFLLATVLFLTFGPRQRPTAPFPEHEIART
jgi:hypothetical protein